ncbi:unnamed protein product [Amoebophrya sp. A25]|nr:unnamed protein product [Amoebophrya sp. A25]|eukprot:GSA25T00012136001.1
MSDAAKVRKQAVSAFSLKGLQLRPKALKAIVEDLSGKGGDLTKSIRDFAEMCKQDLRRNTTGSAKTNVVEAEMVERLLRRFALVQDGDPMDIDGLAEEGAADTLKTVYDRSTERNPKAFAHLGDGVLVYNVWHDVPLLEYNTRARTFQVSPLRAELFPAADRRPKMMQERMHLCANNLYQRGGSSSSSYDKEREQFVQAAGGRGALGGPDARGLRSDYIYFPATHEFPNKQEICRGQTSLYRIKIPVVPRPTHHARLMDIENDDDEDRGEPLMPGSMVAVSEWYTSAHERPEWFLKLQSGRGWIPYRVSHFGVEQDVVEPAGVPTKCLVTSVESLVGNFGHKVTFGLLVDMPDIGSGKKYALQEGRKRIELDLKRFSSSPELIIHGGFYVAEGIVDNEHGVLHVLALWNPPIPRTYMIPYGTTDPHARLRIHDAVNHFGGNVTQEDVKYLTQLENGDAFAKAYYVILADVNLDDPNTFLMLRVIFDRYEDSDEQPHYILMGNFRSPDYYYDPRQEGTSASWSEKLWNLCSLLQTYQHTQQKRVILIPGPNDCCGNPDMMPMMPLHVYDVPFPPNVVLASNPCRIRHFSRQIVICRSNIWTELAHAEVVKFDDQGNRATRFDAVAHYLLSQAHLCPILPVTQRTTLIGFDHSLRLHPVPDVLMLGLGMWRSHHRSVGPDNDTVFIPSFTQRSQYAFYVFYPAENSSEEMLQLSNAVVV